MTLTLKPSKTLIYIFSLASYLGTMFKSLIDAAQNSTFRSPFTSVNCQAATPASVPAPSAVVTPALNDVSPRQLTPNHNIAAAAVAQGGKYKVQR